MESFRIVVREVNGRYPLEVFWQGERLPSPKSQEAAYRYVCRKPVAVGRTMPLVSLEHHAILQKKFLTRRLGRIPLRKEWRDINRIEELLGINKPEL